MSIFRYVPNTLTVSRMGLAVLVFFEILFEDYNSALFLFLLALTTDYLDGAIARKTHSTTKFGADVLETVADATLFFAALFGIMLSQNWPLWILIGLIVGGVLYLVLFRRQKLLRPFFLALEPILDGIGVATIAIWLSIQAGWPWLIISIAFFLFAVVFKHKRIGELLRRWKKI
ncbi:MAG: CDP-alcohol phosphatidyltransferase family protein [bacterium]|nr:CDP-alcohol phosphatidyltransferase family protein [bacterium]